MKKLMCLTLLTFGIQSFGSVIESSPLVGIWEATEDRPYNGKLIPCPLEKGALMKVELIQEQEDTEYTKKGTSTLSLKRNSREREGSWYTAFDRADFRELNLKSEPSFVYMGDGESLMIQHNSIIIKDGSSAVHTVKLTGYKYFLLPAGSSTALQLITIDEEPNRLLYSYIIDGVLHNKCLFTRK